MSENIDDLEKRIRTEAILKSYEGEDRVILAEEKRAWLEAERKTNPPFILKTKFPNLEATTEGFRRGQLIVLSGPPKQGKSSICQTFTKHFVEDGKRCLWFSYELSWGELFDKFPLDYLDLYIPNQMASGNLEWLEQRIIESKAKYGVLHAVFIDHLDFLRNDSVLRKNVNINMSSYIGGIVQKVKRIAVEQEVVIFLMAHIKKNGWTTNELPTAEDLRDSGQVSQLADIVMMMVRQRNKDKGSDDIYVGSNAWLGVIENRHNGKTRRIPVQMNGKEFVEVVDAFDQIGRPTEDDF